MNPPTPVTHAELPAGEQLERKLEELLHQDTFAPPAQFLARERVNDAALHARAELDPDGFWAAQARTLHWDEPFTTVLDDSRPPFYKWFTDGKLNVSYNCLDRHVDAGLANRVAFHWAGEEGEHRAITYGELHRDVQRLANALKALGIRKGDVVGIYLPMIPEVVVAMLACARIGAPHNVVFGGFAPEAVKERMDVSRAKVLITVDGARRKGKTAPVKVTVDEVMGDLRSLEHIVVLRHTRIDVPMADGRDVFYDEIVDAAEPVCPAEPMEAEHPLFILYSSGSTAKPKGIVHTSGGYLTGVSATHRHVFDLDPDRDVSAPTAIRTCMKWGAEHPNAHDLSSLRLLGTVGEPINPKVWLWYHVVIGRERCPIVDTWWQTETGQIMISPLPGLTETKPGSATFALPGVVADVVDERTGESVEQGQGLLVLKRPWPGMLRTLYDDDARYVQTYWSRFGPDTYLVGDAAIRDKDGYLWIVGRIDDVINVSGHRLSTAEVESAIVAHDKVAEAAVVAQADELTGQAIVAFVTLQGGVLYRSGGELDRFVIAGLDEPTRRAIGAPPRASTSRWRRMPRSGAAASPRQRAQRSWQSRPRGHVARVDVLGPRNSTADG